jgi:photosystem II stability/assembly factor-like uncharacterized protein
MNKRRYIAALAGVAALAFGGAWLVGVQTQEAPDPLLSPVPSIYYEQEHNHLHGLGYSAAGEALYLASHFGLFVLREDQLFQLGESRDDFMGFSLHPEDSDILYTSGHPRRGGNLGVMKSTDGGASWEQIFTGLRGETVDFHSMTISAADADRLYGAYGGRLYRSNDGGASWTFAAGQRLPEQGFCWSVPCLHADPHAADRLYAGTSTGLLRSDDQGDTWTRVEAENRTGAVVSVAVAPDNEQFVLAHTQHHGVARSLDGGRTWTPAREGLTLAGNEAVFQFVFDPDTPSRVFLATTGDQVYESRDGGQSWKPCWFPDPSRALLYA